VFGKAARTCQRVIKLDQPLTDLDSKDPLKSDTIFLQSNIIIDSQRPMNLKFKFFFLYFSMNIATCPPSGKTVLFAFE